jgi:hypothetical protein
MILHQRANNVFVIAVIHTLFLDAARSLRSSYWLYSLIARSIPAVAQQSTASTPRAIIASSG